MSAESFTCPKCRATSYNPLDVENRYCGACHIYIDQWLCFRFRVGDRQIDEVWFDAIGPEVELAARRHAMFRGMAEEVGQEWRLEIYDPESDRTARIGSSAEGMVEPMAFGEDEEFFRMVAKVLGFLP